LLKVESASLQNPTLTSLDQVRGTLCLGYRPRLTVAIGDEIGSVEIDLMFADLVEARLRQFAHHEDLKSLDLRKVAEKMSTSRTGFRGYKEEFGTEDSMSRPEYRIELPGLPSTFTIEAAGIYGGKMVFTQ
jgi:hypothetical protein